MEIQTYEIDEAPTTTEDVEAVRALVAQLGLDGQQDFLEEGKAPCPYRRMTADERQVYSACLPNKQDPKHFKGELIPLRVLQVFAHAQSLDIFKSFQIWSAKEAKDDPLLLGIDRENHFYMLARWGDVLESLEVLREKAVRTLREERKAWYQDVIRRCQAGLADIDNRPLSGLGGATHFWDH